MKVAGALLTLAAFGAAACASRPPPPVCPPGQEPLRTGQLFLGRGAAAQLPDAELARFIEQEITPRFPDGVTVLDGGGQWRGSENALIRDAAKVVQIVLTDREPPKARVEAIRAAYRKQFGEASLLLVIQAACVEP